MEEKQTKIEIYFKPECELHVIRVDAKYVSELHIKNGMLTIHDQKSEGWHCYNMDTISHIHYPDHPIF